jgi:2-polyprenyl-3-methyl-5-hydroxy-6-metoxy-1,4-benzoquinol methylase
VNRDDLRKRVLALFDDLPRRDRLHVRGRWKSCPVAAVEAEVPVAGNILEVGCGHGLVSAYLALASPDRDVTGIDIDERKLALAQRVADGVGRDRLRFEHTPDGAVPAGPWDGIVIVDVLYLLSRERQASVLADCVKNLAPNGLLIVKETDTRPRWKYRLAMLQEVLATRVFRITKGDDLTFTPLGELAAEVATHGFVVRMRRVDKGYLHPHALFVARPEDWPGGQG